MKSYNRIKIILLVVLGLGFVLIPTFAFIVNLEIGNGAKNSENNNDITLDNKNLRISKVSGKIHIINNWTAAKSAGICTGTGTYSEPYVIGDLVIDAGGSGSPIRIEHSDVYFIIENCTLSNSQLSYQNAGIHLNSVDNGRLIDNNCSSNYYGIYLSSSYNITISGNNVSDSLNNGIYLTGSSTHNRITNNTVSHNNGNGIHIYQCDRNTVRDNIISNNSDGIYSYSSKHLTVTGNEINHNDGDGLYNDYSDYITITGNRINDNAENGIYLYRTDNNNIIGNVINNNTGDGIYFYNYPYYYYSYDSSYNAVLGNNISDNYNGIRLSGTNNTLLGNRMVGCGLVIEGTLDNMRSHIINSSNFVNDKPLYYYIDKDYLGPDNFTNAGQILLVNCDNSLIFNLTLSNCSTGISLYYSNNNNISENIANNNSDNGIYLSNSHYNNITGNTANNNSDGIHLQSTYGNALSNNRVSNNSEHGIYLSNSYGWYYEANSIIENDVNHNFYGIYLSNFRNSIITANNVSNNQWGIYLTSSSQNNNVSENDISFNFYGIRLGWECDSNTIVRNNIMNNYYGIYLYYCKCNTISGNIFSGNNVDIQGTQEECNPLPFGTDIIIVALIVIFVAIAIIVVGVIIQKRIQTNKTRLPKDEVARYKVLKEREMYKAPAREIPPVKMKALPTNVSRCPYCRTLMNDDWVFCKKCGSKSEKKMW